MLDAASASLQGSLFQGGTDALFTPGQGGAPGAANPAAAFSQALSSVRAEIGETVPNGVWDTKAGSLFKSSAEGLWSEGSGALDKALFQVDASLFGRTASNGNGIWKPTTEAEETDYKTLVAQMKEMKTDGTSFMLSMAMFKLVGSYPTAVTKAFNGLLKAQ